MDRLSSMTVFVAVAEAESFAAGARRLGMSPPAVTRAIAALEKHLGVKLLNRSTRFVRATEAGQRYLDDARRIIGEVDAADEALAGINATPRGQLALTAPMLFGKMFVLPAVVDYLERYPEMEVTALFVDRIVNLLEEGFDVGVRIGELADSSMKGIRVGAVRRVVCAAPKYLKKHGVPAHPAQLAEHRVIAASAVSPTNDWQFRQGAKTCAARVKPKLVVSSNDSAMEAALQGFGVTRLLSYQVASNVVAGKLKIVLADFEPAPIPIHVVHREGRNAPAKIRSFVDLIAGKLKQDSALQ